MDTIPPLDTRNGSQKGRRNKVRRKPSEMDGSGGAELANWAETPSSRGSMRVEPANEAETPPSRGSVGVGGGGVTNWAETPSCRGTVGAKGRPKQLLWWN